MFADSEATSRLMNRPMTHVAAMYRSVAIVKMNDVFSSIRQHIRDLLGPDAYAIFEKMVAAAEAERTTQIERLPTGFVMDLDGDVAVIDDSGEVKQRP
jgi:hypothetical protein